MAGVPHSPEAILGPAGAPQTAPLEDEHAAGLRDSLSVGEQEPAAEPDGIDWEEIEFQEGPGDAAVLAGMGLPADTPIALRIGRVGPPDPVEAGEAFIDLSLLDVDDGSPCSSQVVLWRIAAPANALWTAGDQDIAEALVEGTHRFGPIAAGEYRLVCAEERAGAPQQDSYLVAGVTPITLRLERPKARLALLVPGPDQDIGAAALQAKFGPHLTRYVEWRRPEWVVARSVQPDYPWEFFEEWSSSDSDPAVETHDWVLLPESPDGHELGLHPGDSRHRRTHRRVDLLKDGDTWGAVVIENTAPGPHILVPYPET